MINDGKCFCREKLPRFLAKPSNFCNIQIVIMQYSKRQCYKVSRGCYRTHTLVQRSRGRSSWCGRLSLCLVSAPLQGRIRPENSERRGRVTPISPSNENFTLTWLYNYNNTRKTVRRVRVVQNVLKIQEKKGSRGPLGLSPKSAYALSGRNSSFQMPTSSTCLRISCFRSSLTVYCFLTRRCGQNYSN